MITASTASCSPGPRPDARAVPIPAVRHRARRFGHATHHGGRRLGRRAGSRRGIAAQLSHALLACILVTGCAGTRPGYSVLDSVPLMPPHSPSPTTSAQLTWPSTGSTAAPRVRQPLDATRLIAAPCSALTTSELSGLDPSLGGVTGTSSRDQLGTGCGWSAADLSQAINISFATAARNGLDQIYSERPYMAYWQPMLIDGYPAVAASQYDGRSDGSCVVNAALNDQLCFFAEFMTYNAAQQPRTCALAAQAAGDVIGNLRGDHG